MRELEKLISRIVSRVNVNLREFNFKVDSYAEVVPLCQLIKFYAFYGVTGDHPLYFNFTKSNIGGSYFLGKCIIDHSVLYKSDIRGDELKRKGDIFRYGEEEVVIDEDEGIRIRDSLLVKTLVHSHSFDPENLEEFLIQNTIAAHYSNIHGSPMEGCFLGTFATVDKTALHSCKIGAFAYVNTGELYHREVLPGKIWIKSKDYEFIYNHERDVLSKYIVRPAPGRLPEGIIMDFVEARKSEFQNVFDSIGAEYPVNVPSNTALSRYAVVKGDTHLSQNVLVCQRAYLDNAWMGPGTNAQENSFIVNSRLEKNDITAHGGKIINSHLGERVFVGFNAFVRGAEDNPLKIGSNCIVMPHTIIDLTMPLEIPSDTIVWGLIRSPQDLEDNSIAIKDLEKVTTTFRKGRMTFEGNGSHFVEGFVHRIDHILEVNGAYFKGEDDNKGHAQEGHTIAYNIIQPYLTGRFQGLFPTMDIRP